MGLETFGRAAILTQEYDGRQLELQTNFAISGEVPLDPAGADWQAQKLAYGRQVALQVADRVVLQMATAFGLQDRREPAPPVSTRGSLESDWEMGEVGNGVTAIRQQIGGVFRLAAGRELAPAELILAARDLIAQDVASLAVFALEQRFEGKQENTTDTRIRRENGQVAEFQRTGAPRPPEEAPAPAAPRRENWRPGPVAGRSGPAAAPGSPGRGAPGGRSPAGREEAAAPLSSDKQRELDGLLRRGGPRAVARASQRDPELEAELIRRWLGSLPVPEA